MLKPLPILVLLAACSPVPAPTPAPVPVQETQPAARAVTRYTLVGVITTNNTCSEPTPSAIHMHVTLANPAHALTTEPMRVGLEGRSYTFQIEWKNEWGQPSEFRDLKVTRFDGSPFCSSGDAGAIPFTAPVTGTLVRRDLELRCSCSK